MFIHADNFFSQLAVFRLLWIRGRLGGGKTLLAVAIAKELHRQGITCGTIANLPTELTPPPWDQPHPLDGKPRLMRGATVLFDEAWVLLDNRTFMTNNRSYGAFARKLETYWLFPSVIPLDKRVSYLSVERTMRMSIPVISTLLSILMMIPVLKTLLQPLEFLAKEIWFYRWTVELGYMKDTGWFALANPHKYFGTYDTRYVPMDDGDIGQIWSFTIDQLKEEDDEGESWYEEKTIATDSNGKEIFVGGSPEIRQTASTVQTKFIIQTDDQHVNREHEKQEV